MAEFSFKTLAKAGASHPGRGLILGIESSCDETAAAVVQCGVSTLSSVVASQFSLHAPYGGVVPELASREHLRNVVPVVRSALEKADVAFADIEAIAVTAGPGLAGALLVGLTYAKAAAIARNLPLIGVNHLEGHIHSVLLSQLTGEAASKGNVSATLALPAVALIVSGGHTHLFGITAEGSERPGSWRYRLIGRTLDDAAGEAIDKVSKLLGFGYPGGPWIEQLARFGDPRAIPFALGNIKSKPYLAKRVANVKGSLSSPVALMDRDLLFSFSGIKTAVLRHVELHNMRVDCEAREAALAGSDHIDLGKALSLCDQHTLDLVSSFQSAVVSDLVHKTRRAVQNFGAKTIVVTGGVAANSELRTRFVIEGQSLGVDVYFPSKVLSTDNAAMIAAAAWPKFLSDEFASLDLEVSPRLALA